jgi:hypothetical protein
MMAQVNQVPTYVLSRDGIWKVTPDLYSDQNPVLAAESGWHGVMSQDKTKCKRVLK